jgi:O-antigen/teichoic acid export membrane protein
MLSVLAKAGSPAIVGQFALGLAIAAPVFMFTNFNLRAVQATDARSEFEFADYFSLRVLSSLAALATVVTVACFLRYDPATRLVVVLVAVSKTVESLNDVIAGLLQKYERLHQVAISLIIRGALSLAAFGVVFLRTHLLPAAVLTLVLAWTAVLVFYDLRCASAVLGSVENPPQASVGAQGLQPPSAALQNHDRTQAMAPAVQVHQGFSSSWVGWKPMKRSGEPFFRLRAPRLLRLAVVSAPLGVAMTLISLNTNIPRYILVTFLGEADLGIFASMAYMLVALSLIVNALGQSAAARLARMVAAGDIHGFRRIIGGLLSLGLAVLVTGPPLATIAGRPLLTILYRAEYAKDINVLVVMLVTGGISAIASFLGYGMTAVRSFRMQVPVIGLSTLTTVLLCWLLVPRLGLIGAAYSLLASALVLTVGAALALHSALRRKEPLP